MGLFMEALNSSNKYKDRYEFNISLCYYNKRDFAKALEHVNLAIDYRKSNKDENSRIYEEMKDEDLLVQKALTYLNLSISTKEIRLKSSYKEEARKILVLVLDRQPDNKYANQILQRYFNQ